MTGHTHIPPAFRQDDPLRVAETIARHPFAALVLGGSDALEAVQLPFLRFGDPAEPSTWRFESHLSRDNPVARALDGGGERTAILIFSGPDAYITPSWYADASRTSVPTWNYQSVHVRGVIRQAGEDQPGWLDRHLHDLIDAQQRRIGEPPFEYDHLPETQIEAMKAAIVGIELHAERVEGIEKLGQNKSAADRAGMIAGLRSRGDAECDALADLASLREKRPPTG